jgi:hypothetical protein
MRSEFWPVYRIAANPLTVPKGRGEAAATVADSLSPRGVTIIESEIVQDAPEVKLNRAPAKRIGAAVPRRAPLLPGVA